jgi:hypothetical protein
MVASTMSPAGFPNVSPSAPFGRDPMDGAPLIAPPAALRSVPYAASPDQYDLADFLRQMLTDEPSLIAELLQNNKIDEQKFRVLLNRYRKATNP